jgi:hypothetical protein
MVWLSELRQLRGKTIEKRRVYAVLVDLKRAFDTTFRERLWVRLQEKGFGGVC